MRTGTFIPLFIEISYLVAAALFILGLKRLSSPKTARSGNMLGATGMTLAILATLFYHEIMPGGYAWIIAGAVIGGTIGVAMARLVKMTDMPQLVGLLNGFGGLASVLVAGDEYLRFVGGTLAPSLDVQATIMLSVIIGSVTLSGSLIAFAKLQELLDGKPVVFPGQKPVNAALMLGILGVAAFLVASTGADPVLFGILILAALIFGVLFVIPIGGADMPVVIALLNSYSGIAASMTGFVLHNNVLIISGALVGASGLILTNIMCKAMNRSLANVLFSAFGATVAAGSATSQAGKTVKEVSAEDAAILLGYARSVVFVPGYGMAVSQAQHQVRELGDMLTARGVEVSYAVHAVAGRMPGHMNVLLAEANVSYDQLKEMDQINPEMEHTDVSVVIGANDVVNPAARHDTSSPIYGMPIIDVDRSKTVIVMKRSMNPGFAGIENELFFNDNTRMLFGDARKSLTGIIQELKSGVNV
jgi:H+-translocating NAD(P) transhydrogenase subunit beta